MPGVSTSTPRSRGTDLVSRRSDRERFEREHAARLPTNAQGIVVGAETIRLPNTNERAVLLLHGFNDTPQSVAYLAQALHAAGWSVLAPRLPGHGVRLSIMARESRVTLWIRAVDEAYAVLSATHATVVVCGQSMGGALGVLLSIAHPEIPALVLLAPYLGMPRRLQGQLAVARLLTFGSPYRTSTGGERSLHDPVARANALGPGVITVRTMTELRAVARAAEAELPRLRVPTLYLQSREDNRISARDAERHFAAIGSPEKVQRWLTGCGHIISADFCRDDVAHETLAWFAQHSAREAR
jgi:carboxylesterase